MKTYEKILETIFSKKLWVAIGTIAGALLMSGVLPTGWPQALVIAVCTIAGAITGVVYINAQSKVDVAKVENKPNP